MTISPQLAFRFPHRHSYVAEDFLVADANLAAWAWISRTADWPERRLLVWGEQGCGKTHLLHIWARRTGATWYDGAELVGMPAEPVPQGIAPRGIAIDDADQCVQETALLHLLNICREHGIPVLLSARQPPSRWTINLPDLASRLRAMLAVAIERPDDVFLRQLVVRLLSERQLPFAPNLPDWLLRRVQRAPDALRDAIDRLDYAALAAKGPITRSLASAVLGLASEDPGESDPE